ncbi:transcriptional regulator [Mycobacterium asiaticum]|uniref:Transcriptional regulator n=1 Tax=Mycobacterium asiaticum TaxID=1790 RepID=A0A1A3NZ49_MYCAS|nr:metalloregulator ArsR/SmtB family transcription factor [Mycobacterium asiaticum]OBK27221.1 transcriptional regulator [Mycobacterium asiaticum]
MSKLAQQSVGACCEVAPMVRQSMSSQVAVEMAARFKALADPVRLQLLSSIASHTGSEACVCDISAGVEVSQPTISHHLKVLREAGLLTSQRRASWMYYAVVPEALNVLSMLLNVHADAPALQKPALETSA